MIVIFGAGGVGATAFKNLYKEKSCLIIDLHSLPNNFPNLQLIRIISDFKQIDSNFFDNNPISHYFIQGGIEILYQIFCNQVPEILIAAAPIHVMAELLYFVLKKENISRQIEPIEISDIRFQNQNSPENLNIFKAIPNKIYFSYAKWDERCPDDCMGPPDYCPNFGREKAETVTDFIKRSCKAQPLGPQMVKLIHFPSKQIIGGLGGIFKDTLLNGWNLWLETFSLYDNEQHIIIATSCNCHGVAEEIKIVANR